MSTVSTLFCCCDVVIWSFMLVTVCEACYCCLQALCLFCEYFAVASMWQKVRFDSCHRCNVIKILNLINNWPLMYC